MLFRSKTNSRCVLKLSNKAFLCIDLLPTLCHLTGVPLPKTEIDGKNVWGLISGKEGAKNPHDYYAFSTGKNLESLLSGDGKWKLHLNHDYRTLRNPGNDGAAGKYDDVNIELSLFDMENDPYESKNVIESNAEVKNKLLEYANSHQQKYYTIK